MNRTKIEWTDFSWNPITGCLHDCWYCYAKKLADRGFIKNDFKPTFYPERLKEPWERKKPSKIFVCSVADLFASWTPKKWRDAVLASVLHCPIKHQFQLLTKDPQLIPPVKFPNNVWIGVTVSTQQETWRIRELRENAFGNMLFVSFEPLLGLTIPDLNGIQWVIVGKLTGSKRIKLKSIWVDNIVSIAKLLDIPVFMKKNLRPEYTGKYWCQEFPESGVGDNE